MEVEEEAVNNQYLLDITYFFVFLNTIHAVQII